MAKIQNTSVSAATQVENKKVKKQQQKKEQQVFKGNGNKQTVKKPNDSALKQEIYKKTGFQLKDTANRGKIIPLKVNGKVREYETVGTLTTGGRILVKERGKEVYHVVSHTKDNKLVMLKDDYAKNKIFYESTSSEHKVKYGKKNYVITNSKRDRHGRMSAIDENGKRVVLSSDGKELKTGYVEAEDQKDNMNDYIAKQTKGKSKAEADKIRQQILSGNSSYSNKGVLRFKASNGEVWYYDTKRKTYVKYAEKEAQAIIKNLDKGAKENWLLFRTGLGTDYELLKNTNAQIIDPEVLNKVNKHYSAEYGNKVDKNAQYGSGKYKTAYEAFLASEIGDDEVYQFNAALVKNNAITDQSRRNEILQTNLTKISGFGIEGIGVGVNERANRMAAADAASTKEDYQALQDAAEEENKKKNYKAQFKGQDALQTYIYGVHDGDVQEIDDFNTTLIDPKEDMLDRDEIVRIKAETGVLWAKKGNFKKGFEAQDNDVTKQMFALQSPNGKSALDAKLLKKQAAEKHQDDYLMMARPDLYSEDEIVTKATKLLQGALQSFKSYEDLHYGFAVKTDNNVMQLQATETNDLKTAENLISRAYSLISNNSILSKVKAKMGDNFNVLMKKEDAHFKTNSFKNVTSITDKQVTEYSDKEGKVKLTPEQIAHNKYVVTWLKSQLADLERDKKLNEAKDGWKQDFVNWHRETYSGYATRSSVANKYQLIKSNMARLEAAAEGKLVDASGKPVSFEDAMKNLGETGIQALEQANADYQTAQQTGEFMVDMAVLALPLPKGFNAANTVIKMGNALYKVISKSDKACKVIKITQEAAKGSKIYEVVTNVATKNPKFVENARKVATIMDSSATGAMHMAGKTVVLDASNIATSREGFTSDRISEMNKKVESASLFGGMGGAIGGSTAIASEFVSSAGAKYTVHGVGLVADLMGAAGLMTAESHGETNFWDNLRCVNPDGSFNFEQASMTAMMIFGHLHGMSAVRGKVKPHVELQADGTFKAKLGDNVLTLNKDGIWSDSASGREFRLAENKNGKAELTELTKKEVAARHSEASAEESRGTSTQQIKSFKERINNAKTREELNAIRSEIKKTDLTVQERNELMKESLKVQREWGQAPERRQIVNMATEGEASVMGKPELTALRQEVGIKQSKPGLHFEGETDGANTIINEMKGNDTVNSYIVSRDVEGKAHIEYKVSYENGKATDVEIYNADGTIKELPAETKQAVLDELNKPAETDPVSHSEAPAEESRVNSESHSEAIVEESRVTETSATEERKPVIENKGEGEKPVESNKPAETDPASHSERSEESRVTETSATEERKPVIENKGEGDKPVVEQQTKETIEKPAGEFAIGNTPEQAAAIHNSEVETAGVTPVQQTKAQQLELERLQTLVQSNEGKVILADAMKDPNFGKPLSERVPDEGFKMTEDGRLQIEVDGVVYTQRNKGDAFLVSNDGKILKDCFGEEPKNPSATDNPNLTRLYRDGDGKIFGIENQYGAIDYSHTSPEYYPAGKPNTSLNLSLGRPTENYIMTDNVGRVIYNYNPQLDAFAEYHSTTIQGRGRTMSDSNIVSDLNQAIQDVNLKNTTFSTKKGRQKAYEDVRTQIENAYKDNKLTGQDYENLVANLNAKAEKAGGLIVKETRYQQYVAKRAEVYETNRDLLSDKIDKVATKSDYDNMVAEINESFKSGKIDKESARVLNETLDAKGELIEGVETLSQKKAKIEKQVREIETAQRIEEVEANSQHRAELLDEYLAESGEKLPSEIGTKEYYDEALSTIDRGVKSGLIEPQKAEVLRTQAKEQLARLESESSQPATDKSVVAEESRVTTETPQKTEQTPVNASESEANQIKPETKATETKSAAESNSETYNPEQRAEKLGLKPSKEGNRIDFETFIDGEHPQFVEVDSNGNPVKRFIISLDQNGKPFVEIRATYENGEIVLREQFDEFGEVVAREYADIPVNLSDVDNFLKEYPNFEKSEADGVVTITNPKENFTIKYDNKTRKKIEETQVDKDGLVVRNTFNEDGFIATRESDFVYEGNRYHEFNDVNKGTKSYQQILDKNTGISTEVKPELAKKFAEGTVDDGKFTPKGVNEDANMGEEVFSPYEVIEQNAEGKPTKTVLKNIDGKVLEYNYNEYDSNGNVAKTTSKDATGKVTASHEFEYDSSHNLTKETVKDANGKITGIYDGKDKSLEIPESKIERKSVVEESQVTGEQKKSSLILSGDERKPVKIKTAEEFAKEENKPVQIKTEEEFAKEDSKPVEIKTEGEFAKEDSKPVEIKTEGEFAKKDGQPVEIDSSNTTTEKGANQPIKLDLDTKSSRGDIDAKSHYEVMADKVIVDGEEFPIPQTLEEAKNTKALRHWGGGIEYSIEYTSDFNNSTNRVILKYDTESGKFIGSREEISINGKALKDTSRNADGTIDYTHEYLKAENGQAFEVYRDSNGKPTSISQQYETHKKITFDKEGNASYEVTNEKNETVTKPIEEAFKDYPELKPLLEKQGIKLVEKKAEPVAEASAEKANVTEEHATGNTAEEASNIHNEEVAKAESGAITGDETPVTTEESASAGEETPVSENSETADAKPSKISMFDRLFHKNKVRLEHEVEAGTRISWEHTYKTQRDENGYVRTKTDQETNIVRQKEYFNAKGKKIKTETFDIKGKKSELTEGNVTTIYNEDGTIKTVEYPNHKNVYFKYNDNGKLIGAQFWEGHNDLHPKNWNDSEYLAEKRRTNYEYNSDKGRFELLDEKGKVVTDEKGNPVSTATFDPETRHWVEDGQYSSDLAPKTTNVSRGEGRFRIKLPERNKVPKNLRDENGKLREGVTQNDKGYIESITKDEVVTTKNYDSKGTLVSETTENLTKYYNKNGDVICTKEILPGDKGVKITEKTKDYDLEIIEKDGSLKIIHHTKNENGTAKGTEEFKYSEKNKVYENTSPEGNVLKTVEYDAKNHKWTIKDAEGKKIDSQNNMKESHIKRNIGIGVGVLALGGGIYGVSKLVKSDDDKEVEQPAKPAAKPAPKKDTPAPKAETKVTLGDKEGTIAEDGTLILDGKKYPKDTDGTYTIGDKKYKVEDGKLVEVVDTPDDNGETGGAAPDESPEVKGTIDGKEYIIKDGKVSLGGSELTPDENGHYKIGDDKYKIEDGKLVKVEPEEPAKTDTGTDAAQSDDSQAGGGRTNSSASGTTGSQGGGRTGGSASGTTGSQGGGRTGGSASGTTGSQGGGRTGSSTSGTTGTTHNDTSRPVTTPRSEQSEESRHADNTPVTRVTEPTEAQKQVAKTLQDEISGISTQADVKAFFTKLTSAVKNGQITIMQSDELLNLVNVHVETLVEVARAQNEQDAIQKPEFGLGEVTTPQETQRKEKREITPMERMALTESIRKARDRKDIEKIQQEMRQYKVFPGRKNLRRAYKAKLRAIKHQGEPQKVEKYNEKFEKRMEKIENSKVYEQDSKEILYKIDKKMWDSENFYT